jgi:hypothetical protein
MRRVVAPTLLTLALVAGLVLIANASTAATRAASVRSAGSAQAGTSKHAAALGRTGTKARTWSLRLAPAPDDLALAQIRFPHAGRRAVARDLLHLAMRAPFGADYLAAATPSVNLSTGGAQVLVLLVNRPTALEDPVSVELRLSTQGRLAEHRVRGVENPFVETSAPAARDLCDLSTRGRTLRASDLAPLRSVGAALDGFSVAAAVAQAYDAVCGLPYEPAFKLVVTSASTQPQPAPPQPTPTPPQPQPAPPQPAPGPPVGKLPGEGCVPAPGYACPASVEGNSATAARATDRRAATGAY